MNLPPGLWPTPVARSAEAPAQAPARPGKGQRPKGVGPRSVPPSLAGMVPSPRKPNTYTPGKPELGDLAPHLPPVVALCGTAGVGKDMAGAALTHAFGYERRAFADPVRRVAALVGWDGTKDDTPTGRGLLVALGEGMRAEVGADVWVTALARSLPAAPVVITDLRYDNEAEFTRSRGGIVVRITRPTSLRLPHASERAAEAVQADHTVVNAGTVEDLRSVVVALVRRIAARRMSAAAVAAYDAHFPRLAP